MKNQYEFVEADNGCILVTVIDDLQVDYGRIRTFETESGLKFVADISRYGDLAEIFRLESINMGTFDGMANFDLRILVDSDVLGQMQIWPADNAHVDRLCRLLTVTTGDIVTVEARARILATYDRAEQKEKSHDLNYYYLDVEPEAIEATTWPRTELTYDDAVKLLSTSTRDELRDHAFGDREVYWTNSFDQQVATGYVGSGACEIDFLGFDVRFEEDQYRDLINLGQVGKVERNDETGPEEFAEGECLPGLTLEGVRKELEGE